MLNQIIIHCFGWSDYGNAYAAGQEDSYTLLQAILEAYQENKVYSTLAEAEEGFEQCIDENGEAWCGSGSYRGYTCTIIYDLKKGKTVEDWRDIAEAVREYRESERQHEYAESGPGGFI